MRKCLVGVSGGVDSVFAAISLKSQGFDVYAAHLYLHSKTNLERESEAILKKHNITIIYADYTKEFEKFVVQYFTKEYSRGYTPNPCVVCNRDVKLPMLIKEAEKIGAEFIATGHYADRDESGHIIKHKSKKDQSYFLACVDKNIIKRMLFPLKGYTKEKIKSQLNLAEKESSDLCFVKSNYREILKKTIGTRKGKIVKNNEIVGYHEGFYNYTIGQRKGIQIGNKPHYVVAIDAKHNIVYADEEHKLYNDEFFLDTLFLYESKHFFETHNIECAVRFNAKMKPCKIYVEQKKVKLFLKERAITPGQIAVFYYKNAVVACGKIGYGIH